MKSEYYYFRLDSCSQYHRLWLRGNRNFFLAALEAESWVSGCLMVGSLYPHMAEREWANSLTSSYQVPNLISEDPNFMTTLPLQSPTSIMPGIRFQHVNLGGNTDLQFITIPVVCSSYTGLFSSVMEQRHGDPQKGCIQPLFNLAFP